MNNQLDYSKIEMKIVNTRTQWILYLFKLYMFYSYHTNNLQEWNILFNAFLVSFTETNRMNLHCIALDFLFRLGNKTTVIVSYKASV